jgi:methionyl-tRNA formyltransferase
MHTEKTRIVLLAKSGNAFCDYAVAILKSYFDGDKLIVRRGLAGAPIDADLFDIRPSYILSFLSPWIVPSSILDSAEVAAVNFHPGPPDYPGTGCYNFALYEQARQYGITCHHMKPKVDTGAIIMTSMFDVAPNDTVETLKLKSMNHMLFCFERIINLIASGRELPVSGEKWTRPPFTRKQLRELCRITPENNNPRDIMLRVRATSYPSAADVAYVEIGGRNFYCRSENREPLV